TMRTAGQRERGPSEAHEEGVTEPLRLLRRLLELGQSPAVAAESQRDPENGPCGRSERRARRRILWKSSEDDVALGCGARAQRCAPRYASRRRTDQHRGAPRTLERVADRCTSKHSPNIRRRRRRRVEPGMEGKALLKADRGRGAGRKQPFGLLVRGGSLLE